MKKGLLSRKDVAHLDKEARRRVAKRNRQLTRKLQRDAKRWDEQIAREEGDGGRYALLRGVVVYLHPTELRPSDFMGSDWWFAWMEHHLRRRTRVFQTEEEARFVLFGLEPGQAATQQAPDGTEASPPAEKVSEKVSKDSNGALAPLPGKEKGPRFQRT